jgi:uncharacterized glyoxalase superfamily protein PhnB
MALPARINLVTLGVDDVERASRFYEQLGWTRSSASVPGEVTFLHGTGCVLALWGADELATDAGVPSRAAEASGGYTLALNVESPAAVDEVLQAAASAGARITAPAVRADWGGYHGHFADLDGHVWEIAHNPHWPIGADGQLELP